MKFKRSVTIGTTALLVIGGLGLLAAYATAGSNKSGNAQVPEPAKPVDLDRYLGQWYEFARYENRFERGCEAVTANYAKRDDGLLSIVNSCRTRGVNGAFRSSEGKAKIVPDANSAKLKVSFFGPFYVGDYWVLDHADDYTWSIVGEPSGKYLWILTREAKPSAEQRTALVNRVRALGYDVTLLRETLH
jgi:apolipoprotein D and lipocalin family protein